MGYIWCCLSSKMHRIKYKRIRRGKPVHNPIPHTDSRTMQPLPWRPVAEDLCDNWVSDNGKQIATFWGGDERDPQNMEWCTTAQRKNHIIYATHAVNHFPKLQKALEDM